MKKSKKYYPFAVRKGEVHPITCCDGTKCRVEV